MVRAQLISLPRNTNQTFMKKCHGSVVGTLFLAACLLLPETTFARSPTLDEQRALYREAKIAVARGSEANVRRLVNALGDYPLKPHIEFLWLSDRLRHARTNDVSTFLNNYEDSSLANRLRYRWLDTLRHQRREQDFLAYYRPDRASTEQQCYFHYIHLSRGKKEPFLTDAISLWSVGKSQPNGCDTLFDYLIANQHITNEIAWNRYSAAVLNHQYRLARYLQRFFTSDRYQLLARNFLKVDLEHELIGNYSLFSDFNDALSGDEVHAIIAHGLTHLARTDATTALKHWSYYQQIHPFTSEQRKQVVTDLVKGLYRQKHSDIADNYLVDYLDIVDPSLLEWRTREFISQADWQNVLTWIERMPIQLRETDRWLYWRARAADLNNTAKRPPEHNSAYHVLSRGRSFYGFLASEWTANGYSMAFKKARVAQADIIELKNKPGILRTREFVFHEDYLAARRDWYHTTRNFTEQQWITAAHIATSWQWHNGAITSMISAGFWDDIDLRFPLAFKEAFYSHADKTGVPVHLLFAVARQESALAQDVQSRAGAKGLMQLMPATARETARKNDISYRGSHQLFEPEINIKLGSRYYREMLQRFDNNRILATAAYNAGPHRVSTWLKKSQGSLPFDAWIETIPFLETRNYVQNVLAFSMIYAHHLESEARILSEKEKQRRL